MSRHLKLSGRRVAEGRMNPLGIVLKLEPVRDLTHSILEISLSSVIDVFIFQSTHETLGNAVLGGFTTLRQAETNTGCREHIRM